MTVKLPLRLSYSRILSQSIVQECKISLDSIDSLNEVTLLWMAGQNIEGNKIADDLEGRD